MDIRDHTYRRYEAIRDIYIYIYVMLCACVYVCVHFRQSLTDNDWRPHFSMLVISCEQIKMQGMRKIGERPDIARAVLHTEHDEEARP